MGTILPWAGKAVHQFNLPGVISRDLANTDRLFSGIMLLPMNQYLKNSEVDEIITLVRRFYKYEN